MLDTTLRHLRNLVAFDTRNPPRAIGPDGLFAYLRDQLPGFRIEITDHGAGAVSLYAVRGAPKVLFNVHMDTVPDSPHWSASPFELRVDGQRAVGLGACDIKGAAAGLLAAAQASEGDAAFLFTSDEEANDPRCIAAFLARHPVKPDVRDPGERRDPVTSNAHSAPPHRAAYDAVLVAEPTQSKAVLAHRGIASVLMRFAGRAAHASGAQTPADSALHQAVRWGSRALDHVDALAGETFGELQGLRFNIGRIDGGIKANMIAPTAELRFGFRPLPSMDTDALLATLRGFAVVAPAEFTETFRGPSLPAGASADAAARRAASAAIATRLGLDIGPAVDFWTEASLFSQAGYDAIVYGPGDIAQAHTADEWVALDQLEHYAKKALSIIETQPGIRHSRPRPLFDLRRP